jgi:RNA polymerase sigma factor (TIGR02999 family)
VAAAALKTPLDGLPSDLRRARPSTRWRSAHVPHRVAAAVLVAEAMSEIDRILADVASGVPGASDRLAVLLYDELREIARCEMLGERANHTLPPTAVVHEAYLRLLGPGARSFDNKAHFFGAAARAIREVLVDHARKRARLRRGGGAVHQDLEEGGPAEPARDERWLALDECLQRLAALDPLKARIVELRFFAGMSMPEVAQVLGASESTVARGWRLARAWLRNELDGADGP